MVRSEANRCTRNCFNCPICTSILTTSPVGEGKDISYVLNCSYCMWTTLEIGIKFDKPTNIRAQLDRIANGGKTKSPSKVDPTEPPRKSSLAREPFSPSTSPLDSSRGPDDGRESSDSQPLDPHTRFNALKAFYKDQIALSASTDPSMSNSALDYAAYSSPSSLARIMNLYTNPSGAGGVSMLKKSRQKPQPMREARTPSEGLLLTSSLSSDPAKLSIDYQSTTTPSQRLHQHAPYGLGNPGARSVSDLRPLPTQLRTKRAKRCLACKHILTKPEVKPTSTRYRIRLLAANHIPLVTLRPLSGGVSHPPPKAPPSLEEGSSDPTLTPGQPSTWLLRMQNPLFERVKVSLGCPASLPASRHHDHHRVTILCPQFEMGPNSDVWDEALNSKTSTATGDHEGVDDNNIPRGEQQAAAGKLYESGRNWIGVVMEIIPGPRQINTFSSSTEGEVAFSSEEPEDEEILEIPIRVRLEWKVTENQEKKQKRPGEKLLEEEDDDDDDGRRELAYWMVLGVGRVG